MLFKVGDRVQVLSDSFSGKLGEIHNGRVGFVTAVSYGDVVFDSDDNRYPILKGTYYPPHFLKKIG